MMHFVAKSKTSMEVNGWENNEAILRGGGKLVENVGEARLAIRSAAKLAFSDKYGTVGNFLVSAPSWGDKDGGTFVSAL